MNDAQFLKADSNGSPADHLMVDETNFSYQQQT